MNYDRKIVDKFNVCYHLLSKMTKMSHDTQAFSFLNFNKNKEKRKQVYMYNFTHVTSFPCL